MTIQYEKDAQFALQSKQMELDAGLLGKFFGSAKNASVNIAGFLIVLLIIPGVLGLWFSIAMPIDKYWALILPVISAALGFVFGKTR